MRRRERSSCWSRTKNLPVEKRIGSNPNHHSSAATGASISTMCSRPTRALTLISSSARADPSYLVTTTEEHVLGSDGQFHVEDEAVDISIYGWEDWVTFLLFWIMAAVVFYQVYTRYVLSDSA